MCFHSNEQFDWSSRKLLIVLQVEKLICMCKTVKLFGMISKTVTWFAPAHPQRRTRGRSSSRACLKRSSMVSAFNFVTSVYLKSCNSSARLGTDPETPIFSRRISSSDFRLWIKFHQILLVVFRKILLVWTLYLLIGKRSGFSTCGNEAHGGPLRGLN